MLIACKCLNVTINAAQIVSSTGSDNDSINQKSVEINISQIQQQQSKIKGDHLQFFEKALGPVSKVDIKYQQIDLIQEVLVDHWSLNICIGCDQPTHAVRKDCDLFLLNSTLLTNEEDINLLKTSVNFSTIFGILLNPNGEHVTDVNVNTERKAKNLTQQYRNVVQNEIEDTDERIRRFAEQQVKILETFREKAESEYFSILRLIRNVPETTINLISTDNFANNAKVPTNLETPPATPESTPMSIGNSPILKSSSDMAPKYPILSKAKNLTSRPSLMHSSSAGAVGGMDMIDDSGFFFEMDGLSNEKYIAFMSDVDESDSDDLGNTGDGIAISRQTNRPKSLNIAQSLPVSVPTLSDRTSVEDDYDEYTNADDIAASIKALAKSVHGDAVFGELPRPRFSIV